MGISFRKEINSLTLIERNRLTNSLRYTQTSLLLLFDEIGLTLSKPIGNLLSWLIVIFLEQTRAHLFRLADKLPDDESSDMARRQRIRRFLSNVHICPSLTLIPLLQLLLPLLKKLPEIVLTMDRTNWMKQKTAVNILTVGIYLENRAIPIFWIVWNKAGNSTLEKQKQVLKPVLDALRSIPQLQHIPIHVVADREFASPKLAEWIWHNYNIDCTLRMKRSLYLTDENSQETKLATLCSIIKRGEKRI